MLRRVPFTAAVAIYLAATQAGGIARAQTLAIADTVVIDTTSLQRVTARSRTLDANEWAALNLGRAIDRWLHNDLRGAAALLEAIDITPSSAFVEADRAAFLLAAIYLQLRDATALREVADRSLGVADDSPYREWIRYARLMFPEDAAVAAEAPPELPGAAMVAAAMLLENGQADKAVRLLETVEAKGTLASLRIYMHALALERSGQDAATQWQRLAKYEPHSGLESDLVAAALLKTAADRMESGGDARAILERIPRDSRHAPRALHALALNSIESGDTAAGRDLLEHTLDNYPIYENRRDIMLTMGAISMQAQDWSTALDDFLAADADWRYEFDQLDHLENDEMLAEVWHAWSQPTLWRDEVRLAPEAVVAHIVTSAVKALDLRHRPSLKPAPDMAESLWPVSDGVIETAAWDRTDALHSHYPTAEEWSALRALHNNLQSAQRELDSQEYAVLQMERDLARRLSYLRMGRGEATDTAELLSAASAELSAILAILDGAAAQLGAVRDSVLSDVIIRTRNMTESLRREILFMDALRHFHVDGPQRQRPETMPDGVPGTGEILALERELSLAAEEVVLFLARHYPDLINRSFSEIWYPRLTGSAPGLHSGMLDALARAQRLGAAIDSALTSAGSDPALAAATAKRDELALVVENLKIDEHKLRRDIAHAVAARGRARMASERETIDYHVADASYEFAIEVATNPATAELSDVVTPPRLEAIALLETFLERYPQSIARGESRFRLADLKLLQARDDFRAKMADFLNEDPSADALENRALAPFVDYAPAISLYESILAEDAAFPHTDAVLFNLGMILTDDGRPEGVDYLARLVEEYPDSPDVQEAWLRMASDRFDREDFKGSIAQFEKAIAGGDPELRAIALYKLGWANFEEDRFDASTDAFRSLIDLYNGNPALANDMDLRDEAEEYLVHSLARAGGATAFARYFDTIGGRDYENAILLQLGHLMRSVALYEEAAACDELWLRRYPEDAKSLAVAERLVDTYRSWNKPDEARKIKLAQAARFQPGGSWYEANSDPKLREDGLRFAQSAYREIAAYHHSAARESDDPASWQLAMDNYQRYLASWPDSDDADQIHHLAGEAALHLGRHAVSLAHFEAAAQSDSAALAMDASWQRVAVADAWYRSSQPAPSQTGADSLAATLLNAGHDFIDRFPEDERCADVVWRQANVAYAHEWYTAAAASFTLLSQRYPDDDNAPLAVRMSGDAHYRHGEYQAAGQQYEKALEMARASGQDSLVVEFEKTIPLCYYKHAESIAAADSVHGERGAAPYFAAVAERWPQYEHAHLALYRAGLGFTADGKHDEAVAAWEALLAGYPQSEYRRDSAVQIAQAHEKRGDRVAAAHAWERFSRLHPQDPDAAEALLKSIDLLAAEGQNVAADEMRTVFVERFPDETHAVMEIRAERAERELAGVTAGTVTLGSLLTAGTNSSPSDLKAYLALAEENPELATPAILAQVDYLKAREIHPLYTGMRLTQPLPKAIEVKKGKMEELVRLYERCAGRGITEYARAAAYHIGQVLIEFGDALIESERPPGLSDDDLLAYDEVLESQSWEFYDRGTDVWSELLQQASGSDDDPGGWISTTRTALWPRLAQRFLFQPEVDYPLVDAKPPRKTAAK